MNEFSDDIFCNTAIYADDNFSTLSVIGHKLDLYQQLEFASELKTDLEATLDLGKKWPIGFNAGKLNWIGTLTSSLLLKFYCEMGTSIFHLNFFSPEVTLYL